MGPKNKKTYWRNSEIWVCPKHLPSAKIPKSMPRCWYEECTSVRPQEKLTPKEKLTETDRTDNISIQKQKN